MNSIILEVQESIGIITINRPKALNALNSEVLKELEQTIDSVSVNEDVKAVIITGEGKSFVAGADIGEMKDLSSTEAKEFSLLGNRVFSKIENMPKPVIAAINGFALGGGCELASCCDIRIASEKALIGFPETGLGITPGFGGTQRFPRIVGLGKAKEMIFTGAKIDGNEALNIGFANKTVPVGEALNEAIKIAEKIARNGAVAVRQAKDAINMGMQVDMNTAVRIEAEAFGTCFSTDAQTEAMTKFLEKGK